MLDELLHYNGEEEYRIHYENNYCRTPILTFDGIQVFFDKNRFKHAFFESSNRDGRKDLFSVIRASRMNWIKKTLLSTEAFLFQGYDKRTKSYSSNRRVTVVIDNFVVVISLSLNRKGVLKGKFITCYEANNSISKIKKSPIWCKEECLKALKKG
jgi:hypothetical protein